MSTINTLAENTLAVVTEIADPQVRNIAKRVVKEMTLEIHKVIAHHAEPANYPLPQDPNSVEQILQRRFASLKPEQKQLAVAKVLPMVKASSAQREKGFRDLHQVDLRSATSVAQQARALAFPSTLKIPLTTLQTITGVHGGILDVNSGDPILQQMTDKLELRIHRVKCLDETNGFLGSEAGNDEIALGGTTVDESGDTNKVAAFEVSSSFDDDEVITYSPPRRFALFSLREGTNFPKSYFVTFVLAEEDMGGLSDFLNDLLNKVQEKVKQYLVAALGAEIGASGGPVGAIIGLAVGFAVGKIFNLLKEVWSDDIFPPKTISVRIGSLGHHFAGGKSDSPQAIARFVGYGGTYEVTYDWRVFA